jgi:hypothetical protein
MATPLTRKDSELSDLEYEKAGIQHIDHQDTITEEDEGANVGMAAYHESQKMAEIVRPTVDRRFLLWSPGSLTNAACSLRISRLPSRTRPSCGASTGCCCLSS